MISGRVQVLNEVTTQPSEKDHKSGWHLCFQRVRYIFDDGDIQSGYRFIWRRPDGSLQAARGQARLPSLKVARNLMADAEREGWAELDGDDGDF